MLWKALKEKRVSPEAMEASFSAADIMLVVSLEMVVGMVGQDKLGCRIEISNEREDVLSTAKKGINLCNHEQ